MLVLLALLAPAAAGASTTSPASSSMVASHHYLQRIHHEVSRTHYWQRISGTCCSRYHYGAERHPSPAFRAWVAHHWYRRVVAAHRAAMPTIRALLCIHRWEGSWTDPNSPYYGGLQMDWSFMSAYGRHLLRTLGTADHWLPMLQIRVAARAVHSGRGYTPWPNTARMCGLLP